MSTLLLRSLATLSVEQQLTDEINFDIAIEEFANKKEKKLLCSFHFRIKMVLLFYTFLLFFPIYHFCFLFNCCLQCFSFWCVFQACHI